MTTKDLLQYFIKRTECSIDLIRLDYDNLDTQEKLLADARLSELKKYHFEFTHLLSD